MAVNSGQSITPADMDALATLANAKLLPLVNAAIHAGTWQNQFFDPSTDDFGGTLVYPQPDYGFPLKIKLSDIAVTAELLDGEGPYNSPVPVTVMVWPYKIVSGKKSYSTNPGSLTIDQSSIWPDGKPGAQLSWTAPAEGADGYLLQLPRNDLTTWPSFVDAGNVLTFLDDEDFRNSPFNPMDWIHVINRIRTDYLSIFRGDNPGADEIKLSPDCILSGPWIVGINDPAAYPMVDNLGNDYQGKLNGSVLFGNQFFDCFKALKFYCAAADAVGLSISQRRTVPEFSSGQPNNDFTVSWKASAPGELKMTIEMFYDSGQPVGFSATPPEGVTVTGGGFGDGFIKIVVDKHIAGDGQIRFQMNPAGWTSGIIIDTDLYFTDTDSATTPAPIIHPLATGVFIAARDVPQFSVLDNPGPASWQLSKPTVVGCWAAQTLPAPGMNVFLDQDYAPYIGTPGAIDTVFEKNPAVAGNGLSSHGGLHAFPKVLASSMRQPAAITQDNNGNPRSTNPKWVIMTNGICPRPAPWPIRRDTDKTLLQWGNNFDANKSFTIFQGVLNGKNRSNPPLPFFVFARAVKLKIKAYQGGTIVNNDGIIENGDVPARPLTIKIWNGTDPNTQPPYLTAINEINIPPDAVLNPLDTFWQATVENPNAADTDLTTYDIVIEVDKPGALGYPPISPLLSECFSYCIEDAPPEASSFNDYGGAFPKAKPIPQCGYCIFKLRAARLPTKQAGLALRSVSGPDIAVKIGQMLNGVFTEIQTIVIPAGSSDSGDVAIFWPVIAGQEIRWQCDSVVIVEAWANFQPIFLFPFFGEYKRSVVSLDGEAAFFPTAFQFALRFANLFNVNYSGYPVAVGEHYASVQFPAGKEIYNDLEAALNLLS